MNLVIILSDVVVLVVQAGLYEISEIFSSSVGLDREQCQVNA
jgi:hypothetical protein